VEARTGVKEVEQEHEHGQAGRETTKRGVLEVGVATGHMLDSHIGESSARIHRGGRKVDAAAGNHQRRVKRRRAGNL
jgi:hypothetical protein